MLSLSEISSNLELGPDGIWMARSVSVVSYPEGGNDLYFAIEDRSFWFRHRNHCILEAVRLLPPSGTLFDIGGGNGFVARGLQDAGWDVVLVEPGSRGSANALSRGIRQVVRAAFDDAGFLPGALPAIGLFDVLEHTPDEQGFLASMTRCLAPGGRIYLTVPAAQWLWSHEDDEAGHFRRYGIGSLSRALKAAGLEVEYATHFFGFVPLPALVRRVLPYRLGLARKAGALEEVRAEHEVTGLAARLLELLTARELRRIRRRRSAWFGGSCLAVARKPTRGQSPRFRQTTPET